MIAPHPILNALWNAGVLLMVGFECAENMLTHRHFWRKRPQSLVEHCIDVLHQQQHLSQHSSELLSRSLQRKIAKGLELIELRAEEHAFILRPSTSKLGKISISCRFGSRVFHSTLAKRYTVLTDTHTWEAFATYLESQKHARVAFSFNQMPCMRPIQEKQAFYTKQALLVERGYRQEVMVPGDEMNQAQPSSLKTTSLSSQAIILRSTSSSTESLQSPVLQVNKDALSQFEQDDIVCLVLVDEVLRQGKIVVDQEQVKWIEDGEQRFDSFVAWAQANHVSDHDLRDTKLVKK
eukprot:CAMPEP_0201547480 /NCGR_PEP_ID=MMETSP0173_2-20130828/3939_1 /ASSEMBLY_ACC=CAM_ASM_000268 /TAXON_ID=218659 /ORGANISM="Vexillifera sp., Strain DIVA3 564/2" /LENGTH=292 /DNA_ID=CAMNT_0047956533 /DNA_START=697 /DNA_END=1575 /DNA_ORIENTATION=-